MASKPMEAQVRESLTGERPGWKQAGLSRKWANLVFTRQDLKDQIKDLERKADDANERIFSELAGSGFKAVMVDTLLVQIVDTTRNTLSKEKLLELGVLPSVIEAAMVESHSTYLKVSDTERARTGRKERKAGVRSIRKKK